MSELLLDITNAPEREDITALLHGLDSHNTSKTGRPFAPPKPWAVFLRNAAQAIEGGIYAESWADWLHIKYVWVADALRGQDWGTRLLDQAEAEAKARGCVGIYLDTFSFQALGFYEKRGFALYGSIPDFPTGYVRHYLCKRL